MARTHHQLLLRIRNRHGVDTVRTAAFVETGTFEGATTAIALSVWPEVVTIEQSPVLAEAARQKFTDRATVTCLEGNSADLLASVSARYATVPVCWYLDAHWFPRPGVVDLGAPFPLWAELAVLADRDQPDTIVVDDVKNFGTSDPLDAWQAVNQASIQRALGPPVVEWLGGRIRWAGEDFDHYVIHRGPKVLTTTTGTVLT